MAEPIESTVTAPPELPALGSVVRIHEDADGSGSLARGQLARVTGYTEGSYGLVPMVLVELVDGPTDAMKAVELVRLDLYGDEYDGADGAELAG